MDVSVLTAVATAMSADRSPRLSHERAASILSSIPATPPSVKRGRWGDKRGLATSVTSLGVGLSSPQDSLAGDIRTTRHTKMTRSSRSPGNNRFTSINVLIILFVPCADAHTPRSQKSLHLAPIIPRGPNIVHTAGKMVNLARQKHRSLYSLSEAWMRNDPIGSHLHTRASRSALAFLALPGPDKDVALKHSIAVPTEEEQRCKRQSVDDAIKNSDNGQHSNKEDAHLLLDLLVKRCKESNRLANARGNDHNVRRYRASLRIIQSDFVSKSSDADKTVV